MSGNGKQAGHATGGAPPPPEQHQVSSPRLLTTLATAGAIAGFLLVFAYRATQPTIQAYKAEMLRLAVHEVLAEPDRYDTLYVYDGALTLRPPEDAATELLERVYVGYRANDERVGFAIAAGEPGFQDVIRLIFGYDPATQTVLGMKVLESRETPGLGDKIEKDSAFVMQFGGAVPPLLGVKAGSADEPNEVDMITGATISSRTVIRIINNALERLGPLLAAYGEEVARR